MRSSFYRDIQQQPQTLRDLVDQVEAQPIHLPANLATPLLTGMGASYHAARIAADHFQAHGVAAQAVEATELLFHGDGYFAAQRPLIFVSQSGESAEVTPVTARLAKNVPLIAVTNAVDSTLAQRADVVVPLAAMREEALVASKTYVNSVAALWLLVQSWCGREQSAALGAVARLAAQCQALLHEGDALVEPWLTTLGRADTMLFTGHGPGAVTARHTAMMLGEWAKTPALSMSLGAFRHGPIEFARAGLAVAIFTAPGAARESAAELASELVGYGAQTLTVEEGRSYTSPAPQSLDGNAGRPEQTDPFLGPILDAVAAQLFCEALAQQRQVDPTFRHIGKVVTRI